MADKSRHAAVWEWLLTCPHIRALYFAFCEARSGDTAFVPMTAYTDETLQEFVDGSCVRSYEFALVRFDAYSVEPNDEYNLRALEDAEKIAAWVRQQSAEGNFPEFAQGCRVLEVEAVAPGEMIGAWDDAGVKHMLHFRIRYEKE